MSISAQELKEKVLSYYGEWESTIHHVRAYLQNSKITIEQKYQEDLDKSEREQKNTLCELESNYNSQVSELKEQHDKAYTELISYVNSLDFRKILRSLLANLYYDSADYNRLIEEVGIEKIHISFHAKPINTWHSILSEAAKYDKVYDFIPYVIADYPNKLVDSSFTLLNQNYLEKRSNLQNIESNRKEKLKLNIETIDQQYRELKANLAQNLENGKNKISTNLQILQEWKKRWKTRTQAIEQGRIGDFEEDFSLNLLSYKRYPLKDLHIILKEAIGSDIQDLHNKLFLSYTVYCLSLKGRESNLLERIIASSLNLDLIGGTLHSHLLYADEPKYLHLELEQHLQSPYVTAWHQLPEYSDINDPVLDCAVSPEGNWVLTAHTNKALKLWDVTTGTMEGEPLLHKTEIYDCYLSYNGVKAVTASADGLRLWHLISGTEYDAPGSFITTITKCCAFNQDSSQFIWSEGQILKGWIKALDSGITATSDYETVKLGQFHNQIIQRCAWAPYDKQVMAIAGSEIKIWDIEDDSVDYTFSNDDVYLSCCAWHPNGTAIVFGTLDHILKVWETTTNKVQHILVGHTAAVRGCVWSKSGEWIVSVSDDKTLKVWDANTGNCVSTFYADGPLTCCAIRADAQLVIAGGYKGIYWLKFNYNPRKDI